MAGLAFVIISWVLVTVASLSEAKKAKDSVIVLSRNSDKDYLPSLYEYPFLATNLDHRLYKQTDADSFPIMQAPVALSNPIWNLISHASRMYSKSRRATEK
ncbi:unnamed protein product [Bursaphelenchus okinawaensis]|uniref:Uncharacterized protein n=1 Tax=Bursaphelenchus okinawaensis TaxID=465554 RepID=A0A811KJH4_9BILA|nr:unnamed protein product [Bursaphelenchus okinawaensis]CAG9105014.1 unnamed protein product [Bursaphelenchus okinawaensis]